MTTIYLEIPEMEVRPKHGQTSPSDSKGEKHDTPHNEPERVNGMGTHFLVTSCTGMGQILCKKRRWSGGAPD
jgi:hypothetical protein